MKKKSISKEVSELEKCILKFVDTVNDFDDIISILKNIKRTTKSSDAVADVVEAMCSYEEKDKAIEVGNYLLQIARTEYPKNAINNLIEILSKNPETAIVDNKISEKLEFLKIKTKNPFFAMNLLLNSNDPEIRNRINKTTEELDRLFSQFPKFKTSAIKYFAGELRKKT